MQIVPVTVFSIIILVMTYHVLNPPRDSSAIKPQSAAASAAPTVAAQKLSRQLQSLDELRYNTIEERDEFFDEPQENKEW